MNLDGIIKMARCSHEKRSGGNDYIICDDCGLMWDYRKESANDGLVNFIKLNPLAASVPLAHQHTASCFSIISGHIAGPLCNLVAVPPATPEGTLTTGAGGPQGWQPIETAPKDGTKILVRDANWCGRGENFCVSYWTPYKQLCSRLGDWSGVSEATHWMPLPAAPVSRPPDASEEK